MLNKTVEMYNDGYELYEIVGELSLDVSEILESLKSFVEESKIARGTKCFTFTTEFKQLLANRYQSGFSLYSISKELGISTSTVSKYLKQAGMDTKKQDNKRYEVLEWNDFETCPCCKSKRNVRKLGLHNQETTKNGEPSHSLCLSCNTEWYAEPVEVLDEKGKPLKDENGDEIIRMETRKVLWELIN